MTPSIVFWVVCLCPLVGALVCLGMSATGAKYFARVVGLVPLLGCLLLLPGLSPDTLLPSAWLGFDWLPGVPVTLAPVSWSMPLLCLTLAVSCAALWSHRGDDVWTLPPCLLFVQAALVGIFTAQNLLLFLAAVECFYLGVFFIARQQTPRESAFPEIAFSLCAGALGLGCAVVLGALKGGQNGVFSTERSALLGTEIPEVLGPWLFWMLALSLLARAPVVPAHAWLRSLLQSPSPSAKMLAAGCGGLIALYGWLQWLLPIFPGAAGDATALLGTCLALSLIYAAFSTLGNTRLVAWIASATAFQNSLVLLALTPLSEETARGAILTMGIWSLLAISFIAVTDRLQRLFHSEDVHDIGSLTRLVPRTAVLSAGLFAGALALPGTGLFAGLLLILSGTFAVEPMTTVAILLAWSVFVLCSLRLVQPLFLGPSAHTEIGVPRDLGWARWTLLMGLFALTLAAGLFPARAGNFFSPVWKSLLGQQRASA